jgi:hypothetical protein
LELLALVWALDTSYIECRHAAVRRLLRVMVQATARDVDSVSADLVLLSQRILESSCDCRTSAKEKRARTQANRKQIAVNKRAFSSGIFKRPASARAPKADEKKTTSTKGHKGGMGQRAAFSRILRGLKASEITDRKELFKSANAEYNIEKTLNSPLYNDLVRSGAAGKRARMAGGFAFGAPAKVARKMKVLDIATTSVQAHANTFALAVRDSSSSITSAVARIGAAATDAHVQMSVFERNALRKQRVNAETSHEQRIKESLEKWNAEKASPALFGTLEASSSVAGRPAGAGNDLYMVSAPGSKILERALSSRKNGKIRVDPARISIFGKRLKKLGRNGTDLSVMRMSQTF